MAPLVEDVMITDHNRLGWRTDIKYSNSVLVIDIERGKIVLLCFIQYLWLM